jgi:hypothetical protein
MTKAPAGAGAERGLMGWGNTKGPDRKIRRGLQLADGYAPHEAARLSDSSRTWNGLVQAAFSVAVQSYCDEQFGRIGQVVNESFADLKVGVTASQLPHAARALPGSVPP